jgi:hypothetical protein
VKSRSFGQLPFAVLCIGLFVASSLAQQPTPAPPPAPPLQLAPVPRPRPAQAPLTPAPVPEPVPVAPMAVAVPEKPASSPDDAQPLQVRVFALKYAKAEDVAKTIAKTSFGRSPLMAIPDPRTNCVILTSTADRFKTVEELVRQLDVPVADTVSDRLVQVLELRSARAEELAKVLQGMVPDATFAADRVSNKLVFSGNAASQALVHEITRHLDQEKPADVPEQGRKVRVVWLVSDSELPPPPPDMKDVVDELGSMGITKLGLAAQSMVQAVSSGKFSIQCSPAAFANCRLRIEGTLQESKNEVPRLELMLNASGALPPPPSAVPQPPPAPGPPVPPAGSSQLASISTTVMASPGHKVVLGVVPIEKYTSVFVIQILPGMGK